MPHVIGTVGDTEPDIQTQERWIEAYLQRADDYYFIIEFHNGTPLGTIGIYDIANGSAEWGRWITLPGVMVGLASAMLVHDIAFDQLGLRELRGCIVSDNERVISFHRRFGAEQTGVETKARFIGGQWIDLIWIVMRSANWPAARRKLAPLAETAASSIIEPNTQIP
jgi:RimJ/RimL family protein N-acetyltransferase